MYRSVFRALWALAGALPLSQAHGQSQAAPAAGQLLRELQPAQRPALRDPRAALPEAAAPARAASAPPGVTVQLKSIRITGAQTQPVQRLQSLLADALGRETDLPGLQALADRITAHYRAQGYLLAYAWLPAQEVRGGEIEIAVVEGRLGRLKVGVAEGLPAQDVRARLAHVQQGEPLMAGALEGDLLALSEVPGVRVQSVLRPGESVGTSDLDIEVAAGARLVGSIALDNFGNRSTGEVRASANLRVASPVLFGDALDASAVDAGRGLGYARVAWQAPLGGSAWQAGVAQSFMRYRLGGDFAPLNARGTASDSTLYLVDTLLRRRSARWQAMLAFDHKRFDDEANGAVALKRAEVLSFNVAGEGSDEMGAAWGSAGVDAGRLRLDPANVQADAQGHRTAGRYARLAWQGGLQHALGGGWSAGLRITGQWASKNLDSSEKLALGGQQGVRAYPQEEASSDDGLALSAELRASREGWRPVLFADFAHGRAWHHPLPSDAAAHRTLHGIGAGADVALPQGVVLEVTVAQPTSGAATNRAERGARAWVQLNKKF